MWWYTRISMKTVILSRLTCAIISDIWLVRCELIDWCIWYLFKYDGRWDIVGLRILSGNYKDRHEENDHECGESFLLVNQKKGPCRQSCLFAPTSVWRPTTRPQKIYNNSYASLLFSRRMSLIITAANSILLSFRTALKLAVFRCFADKNGRIFESG